MDRPVRAEMFTRSAQPTRARSRSSSRASSRRRSSSTRSHLLKASTSARPDSMTDVITRWSCSVIGSLASMSTTATSAASIADRVRSEAKYSVPLAVRTRLRKPAVSTNRHVSPSSSSNVSTGSTVVPATSCTTDRCSPANLLSRLDLPTLGLPTSATRRGPAPRVPLSRGADGNTSRTASRRSPVPRPCNPLTGCGSPSPSVHSAAVSATALSSSTLVAASTTGVGERRNTRATASSVSVAPTVASTTSKIASAVRMASSACAVTAACRPRASGCQPPVSTTVKRRPFHNAS
jgi:hypothetical protein